MLDLDAGTPGQGRTNGSRSTSTTYDNRAFWIVLEFFGEAFSVVAVGFARGRSGAFRIVLERLGRHHLSTLRNRRLTLAIAIECTLD